MRVMGESGDESGDERGDEVVTREFEKGERENGV